MQTSRNCECTDVPGEFAANIGWLQTHWQEYNKRWVALLSGELLISGDKFEDIQPYVLNHPKYQNVMSVHIGYDYIGVG